MQHLIASAGTASVCDLPAVREPRGHRRGQGLPMPPKSTNTENRMKSIHLYKMKNGNLQTQEKK